MPGMEKPPKLGKTDREMEPFRDVEEEDRSIELETITMKVHAERLEPITEGMEEDEQQTEAWITGRWQPVVLHPARNWVDRIVTESAGSGGVPRGRWKLAFIHGGWEVVDITWKKEGVTEWLEGRVRSLRLWADMESENQDEEEGMPELQQVAWTNEQLQRALRQQEEEYRGQEEYREFNRNRAEEIEEERQLRQAFGEWRNGILHEHRVWNDRDMMGDLFGPAEKDSRRTLQCRPSSGYLDRDRWVLNGLTEEEEELYYQLDARRLEPRGHVVAGRAQYIGSDLIMIRVEGAWVYGIAHPEGYRIYREPGVIGIGWHGSGRHGGICRR